MEPGIFDGPSNYDMSTWRVLYFRLCLKSLFLLIVEIVQGQRMCGPLDQELVSKIKIAP